MSQQVNCYITECFAYMRKFDVYLRIALPSLPKENCSFCQEELGIFYEETFEYQIENCHPALKCHISESCRCSMFDVLRQFNKILNINMRRVSRGVGSEVGRELNPNIFLRIYTTNFLLVFKFSSNTGDFAHWNSSRSYFPNMFNFYVLHPIKPKHKNYLYSSVDCNSENEEAGFPHSKTVCEEVGLRDIVSEYRIEDCMCTRFDTPGPIKIGIKIQLNILI